MAFPDSPLDLKVEVAPGVDVTDSPLTWTWLDISDRYRQQALTINRGRPSEAGQVSPSSMSMQLENLDGLATPGTDDSSALGLRRGTPIRVWAEGSTPGLVLDGLDTSAGVSTPDDADFDFAGSFDIRVKLRPDQWAGSRTNSDRQTIVRKAAGSPQDSFTCELLRSGQPELRPSSTGSGLSSVGGANEIEGRVADVQARWVAWVFDHDNSLGLGSWIAYSWPAYAGDPPADVTTWDLVAQAGDVGSGFGAVFNSTAVVEIGSAAGTNAFRGVIETVEIRDDINGILIADPDFTDPADIGAGSVIDSIGHVWTLNGSAEITTRRLRFAGSIDDATLSWPLGDNRSYNALGTGQDPTECWTSVDCGSVLRRVQQNGRNAIRSPIYRKLTTNNLAASFLWGYWPMEVGEQSARAPSAIDHDDMTLSGFTSTDQTILSSEPLPSVGPGTSCDWAATVPTPAGFFDSWGCAFVFRMTNPDATYRRVMAVGSAGTAATWEILYSSAGFRIRAEDGGAVQLFQTDEGPPVPVTYGGWFVCYLRVSQAGGNISWQFDALPWSDTSGATADTSGSFVGTVGEPTSVGTDTTTADGSDFSVGHVAIYDIFGGPFWELGFLDQACNAHIGETAAARFVRLCEEEDIPGEVLGDYLTDVEGVDIVGDLTLSEPMGPQQPGPFLDVLQQCAALDGGLILERSGTPGLLYRTRAHIEAAQAVVGLAIDGAVDAGLRPGLAFTNDVSRYRNTITARVKNGGWTTAIDAAGVAEAGTRAGPDIVVNALATTNIGYLAFQRPELTPLVGSQLAEIATRFLAAAVVDEPRVAALKFELKASPDKLPDWHDLAGGDRVTLDNLPGQWDRGLVDLTVEGLRETVSPAGYLVELTCSPTAAWVTPIPDVSPLDVVGSPEWEYAVGNPTVTNPDPTANGNTVLAIAIGQGTTNSPAITITPPPGVTATELTLLAVTTGDIRVRAWTYPNDGAASKAFGYSGGSDNRTDAILIPLDGVATTITQGGTPVVDNGPVVSFPSVATLDSDLVIPFAGRRANSETPGALTGYTVIDDDTGEANNPKGVAWRALAVGTPTQPPDVTWSGSAGTHAQAVVAFRGSGGGGVSPPAARIANANLVIDLDATDASTWGNTRPAGSQWNIGGGVFNPNADDSFGPLVWEVDDQTILWPQNMEDGTDEILQADTYNGIAVVNTARQYVVDGSYLTPAEAGNNHGDVANPPSMELYFDGTRSTLAHEGDPVAIGPAAIPLVVGCSFVCEPWMFADDWTSGPFSLHSPTIYHTGPIGSTIRDGELYLSGKYSLTDIDPDSTTNIVGEWESPVALALPAVGEWVTVVVEFVVDPGGTGYYNWYRLDHTLGTMHLVHAGGNDFGWKFDEADPGYTDENDNFSFRLPSQYEFHQFTPPGVTENWHAAGATAAGATFPNVRRLRWPYASAAQAATEGAYEMIGHAKFFLGIT